MTPSHCLILLQASPVYSHGHGGMQKKRVAICKASWGPGLEWGHHPVCCFLLVKVQVSDCDGKSHKLHWREHGDSESINYAISIISLLYSTGRKLPKAATLFYRVQRPSNPKCSCNWNPTRAPHPGLCLSSVPTAIVGWSLLWIAYKHDASKSIVADLFIYFKFFIYLYVLATPWVACGILDWPHSSLQGLNPYRPH